MVKPHRGGTTQTWCVRRGKLANEVMTHTLTKLHYHCIFTTKHRRPTLTDDIRARVYGYIRGILAEHNAKLIAVGGITDHVHLFVELPPALAVADAMRLVKTNSSKWLRESFPAHADFRWQRGYAAFTVSRSAADEVVRYIEDQKSHHRVRTFDEEYRAFLERHGLEAPVDAIASV